MGATAYAVAPKYLKISYFFLKWIKSAFLDGWVLKIPGFKKQNIKKRQKLKMEGVTKDLPDNKPSLLTPPRDFLSSCRRKDPPSR